MWGDVKNLIKTILISILLGASSIGFVYVVKTNFFEKATIDKTDDKLIATITGAVENPGDYFFKKEQTIREIIFKAQVKNSADIYLLGLEMKQTKSFEIIVPYKIGEKPKLKYSKIESINQLKSLGIKESVAKILIKYKKENRGIPTWKDIDDLPGVGEKTLIYLKENIELL